jgi:hypothetical protein
VKKRFRVKPVDPRKEGMAYVFSVEADTALKVECCVRGTFDDCCRRWRVKEVIVIDYDRPEEEFRYVRHQTRRAVEPAGQGELEL